MALIDLIDVSKRFGDKVVLDNVNFSINAKERIAIIGKNGDGKSTLMNIISQSLAPDAGRVIKEGGLSVQMLSQTPKFDDSFDVRAALKH